MLVNEDDMEELESRHLRFFNSLSGWRKFSVRRDNIVDDFLEAYKKEGMDSSRLTTEFVNEEGMDVDGVTREAFTLFWNECFYRYFEGTGLYVPRVDPDCTKRLFHTLGRIASHGFCLTKGIPSLYCFILFCGCNVPRRSRKHAHERFLVSHTRDGAQFFPKCIAGKR
ncbi:hypothetical protein OS493_012884 [Desmophyllum pertusum]|uniref:HECT domain-containing protein n=1 Tax=Desmophyllum pertusum TaxID=174260 RepID=A0A9W9Z0Y3_9CNID|nr:hypothetical protein OS493_012884 [Desmophyllum pertusum]